MSAAELVIRLATAVEQSTNPRCVTCRAGFDFPAGQQPEILRRVAYGVIWDVEWRDEPGALEFVEARDACGGPQLYCARRAVSDSAVAVNHNHEESGKTPAPTGIGLGPGGHLSNHVDVRSPLSFVIRRPLGASTGAMGASPASDAACEQVHCWEVNSDTDFGVPGWKACVQKPMFLIERSSTMVRTIARRVSAVALAFLPALILILSAAPMCGNGGCVGDDLSAPPSAIVVSLP